MAKGKHQASQNAKKLRDAEERIADLEGMLESERACFHDREESLKADIQALRNRLHTEVEAMADKRVRDLERLHEQRMEEAERIAESRVRDGLARLSQGMVQSELTMKGWPDWEATADAFGISVGDFLALAGKEGPANRGERRVRASQIKGNNFAQEHERRVALHRMRTEP